MLKRPERGYTIIETLIFLAVSGIMLGAAVVLVQGWQAKVQFDQSMRDLNSKVEEYVQDVGSGFFPGSNNYTCSVSGNRPALQPGQGSLGSNQDCIFLGKAIGAAPNSNQLVIYTVLGDRVYPSGPYEGSVITNFDSAYPEPEDQLTQYYQLLWGATIKSSTIYYTDNTNNPTSQTSALVGFYNDLQNTSQAGAPYVLPKAYNTADLNSVKACIEESGACANYRMTRWDLCIASNGGGRDALLTVSPTGLGVSTKINIGGC